jgi:hypothetical protein
MASSGGGGEETRRLERTLGFALNGPGCSLVEVCYWTNVRRFQESGPVKAGAKNGKLRSIDLKNVDVSSHRIFVVEYPIPYNSIFVF